MTKTALIACAALIAATAAPAFAGDASGSTRGAAQAGTPIVVALCDRDALTQPTYRREHGGRPVFVTADEVLNARALGERWSAPRCMTASQHQRLTQRMGARSAL